MRDTGAPRAIHVHARARALAREGVGAGHDPVERRVVVQDAFEQLARNIGKFFEPVFKWMLDGITKFIERLNDATVMQDQIRASGEAARRTRARFGLRQMNPFDQEVRQYQERLEKSWAYYTV